MATGKFTQPLFMSNFDWREKSQMKSKIFQCMKKIVGCVVFLSILLGILSQSSYFFRYEEHDSSMDMLNSFYAEEKNSIDVALVGSSATYRYYAPALMYHKTGLTVGMYAYHTVPFEVIRYAIDEVEKTQKPKLYIIELRRLYQNLYIEEIGKINEEHTKGIYRSSLTGLVSCMPLSFNRAAIIKKTIPKYLGDNEFNWQFEYMRTHENWKKITVEDFVSRFNKWILKKDDARIKEKDKYKISRLVSKVKPTSTPNIDSFDEVRSIEDDDLRALDDLIKYIKKHKLNVLFVSTPYPITEIAFAYEKFAEDYLIKNNIPYLNCNRMYKEIGIDFQTDFYDDRHCNISGALKFTDFISDYIKNEMGIQPEEKTKEIKAEWDKAYELWYEKKAVPGLKKYNEALANS